MSWLRRSDGRTEAWGEPPLLPAAPPPAAAHAAAGLQQALERLPRAGASVLDLGVALAANVAFFNERGGRLRIADLDAAIDELGLREAPAATWERKLPDLLPLADGERFDLVLAWDLPNYVGRERWPLLARRIAERLTLHGCIHLLARVGQTMPARPCRFRILSAATLSEDPLVAETIPAPRLPHAEIERLHPGLVAPSSHLGKHGVQEFVLVHAEEHHLPPRRVAQARKRPPSPAIRIPGPAAAAKPSPSSS